MPGGERGVENRKWEVGSGKWKVESGKWGMETYICFLFILFDPSIPPYAAKATAGRQTSQLLNFSTPQPT